MFVITDLASGGELLERLASRKGHSERDAAKAVRDALAALNVCDFIFMNFTHRNAKYLHKLLYGHHFHSDSCYRADSLPELLSK